MHQKCDHLAFDLLNQRLLLLLVNEALHLVVLVFVGNFQWEMVILQDGGEMIVQ